MPTRAFPSVRIPISVLCVALAVAGCSGDTGGTGPTEPEPSVEFLMQPSTTVAGEVIEPPVEVTVRDASGGALEGSVTIDLDPNPCEWQLSGTRTAPLSDGIARFETLVLDVVGEGYTLRATSNGASATSASFDVRSGITTEPVHLENVLCLEPNPQHDGESLAYVPRDDGFWIGDDDGDAIFEVDRRTGTYRSTIAMSTIVDSLPEAGACDDGDGDPETTCSYIDEIELLAYDPPGRSLYLVNTVNTSPPDRPAIFRLTREGCAGCFAPESWQPLSEDGSYTAIDVVEGEIYLALGKRIYPYDYDANEVSVVDASGDSLPPAYEASSPIVGMSYDGAHMWLLTNRRDLHEVAWDTRTVRRSYDLGAFNFSLPRGLEVVRDTVYVLEGDIPNPIYVLSQSEP